MARLQGALAGGLRGRIVGVDENPRGKNRGIPKLRGGRKELTPAYHKGDAKGEGRQEGPRGLPESSPQSRSG